MQWLWLTASITSCFILPNGNNCPDAVNPCYDISRPRETAAKLTGPDVVYPEIIDCMAYRSTVMERIEKTVFISYRHADNSWGLSVFQDLSQHGYDVFIDYDGIASGNFETVVLENIRARAHFVVVLTPTALDRCHESMDWMRREIEAALDSQRNIVPLMFSGFDFSKAALSGQLTGKLRALRDYHGVEIPKARFFSSEMERLRSKFLNVPVGAQLHPISDSAQLLAKEQKDKATFWVRAKQVIHEEAGRTRVAAKFLPLTEPLTSDEQATIKDTSTVQLVTLQVKVFTNDVDMAYPEGSLRHAANVLARLEDAVVFGGLVASPWPQSYPSFAPPWPAISGFPPPNKEIAGRPYIWEILNGEVSEGIVGPPHPVGSVVIHLAPDFRFGANLVNAIFQAFNALEANGEYGPFAVVLGNDFFMAVQRPDPGAMMLPKDHITPVLGNGGVLLRSPILPISAGVVVALGERRSN